MFGILNFEKRMYEAQVETFVAQRERIKELQETVSRLQRQMKDNIREKESKTCGLSIENLVLLDSPNSVRLFSNKIDGFNIMDTLKVTIIIDHQKKEMYDELESFLKIAKGCQRSNL